MSTFDSNFPAKPNPKMSDRVFGFDSEGQKNAGITNQALYDLFKGGMQSDMLPDFDLNSLRIMTTTAPDGKTVKTNFLNSPTGERVEYKEVDTWVDGTPMTDSRIDNVMFKKSGDKFFFASDAYNQAINIERYRLPGDSDHTVIQKAFDFISSSKVGYTQFYLRIPSGKRYYIDQPLLLNTHSDVFLIGDGIRKSSIYASAEMDDMIVLSKPSPQSTFVGRCVVKGISLFGGGLVNCLINGTDAPYSTYEEIEFVGLKNNGTALKINGWGTVIEKNKFNNQSNATGLTGVLLDSGQQVNGVAFRGNVITNYHIGLHVDNTVNLLDITGANVFDNCPGTGIYFSRGSNGVNINGNYFERCGYEGITVTKGAAGSPTENWKGAIVGHQYYVSTTGWFYGLNIHGNFFANNSDANSGTMTFSGLIDANIHDNFPYVSNITKFWVDLKWEGSARTQVRRVKISQSFVNDTQNGQLIGMNADSQADGHCGIVAIENKRLSYASEYSLPVWNDFLSWGALWNNVHETEPYRGQKNIVLRSASRPNKEITIPVTSTIAGRYYRVNWFQKSDTSATTNLDFKVDGTTVSTFIAVSNSGTWQQGGRGALIYIPSNATSISFTLRISNNTVQREIAGFSIVPASYDISDKSAEQPTTDVYRIGGTPEGFQFAKAGMVALDLFNGKVYTKKTDESLNTGWKELAEAGDLVSNVGANLANTSGENLLGTVNNGAITKLSVTEGNTGFPVVVGEVLTFNGPSLQRTFSLLKDRDTNKLYVQTYNTTGVGQGWTQIGIQAAASANTATVASGATPTKAEFDALLNELRDLKTKMRTAGLLAN